MRGVGLYISGVRTGRDKGNEEARRAQQRIIAIRGHFNYMGVAMTRPVNNS